MRDTRKPLMLPAHGGQLRHIAEHFDTPAAGLLDFSTNLSPWGPPASVMQVLRDAVEHAGVLRDYPDPEMTDLRTALSGYAQVPAANLAAANGMRPLLDATLTALQVRRCALPVPAFGEYRRSLEQNGVEVRPLPLSAESEFHFDGEQAVGECRRLGCDALLFANPQNPSGVLVAADDLRKMVGAAGEHGVRILLDEAFIDFAPEESLTGEVLRAPHLIVYRSVTKFFAMAGLRVAFVAAGGDICRKLAQHIAPWPVSTLAALTAAAAVRDAGYIDRVLRSTGEERAWLHQQLVDCGMRVFAGRANYLLLRLPEGQNGRTVWERLIVRHRIVVRSCANFEGLSDCDLRVAVRRREENQRLVDACRAELFS